MVVTTDTNFNPRSREGSDGIRQESQSKLRKFQSTLPRRERLYSQAPARAEYIISIHAPAKGATGNEPAAIIFSMISIHAPAKGATHLCLQRGHGGRISIHAPAKGATIDDNLLEAQKLLFQSTLPRRERPPFAFEKCLQSGISIHAPAKGATTQGQFLC